MSHRVTSMQFLHRCRAITLIVVCFVFLSSCSTKLSYNFLDWWLSWTVRDYVALDRKQRLHVNNSIDEFHQWHRQTQLPIYARLLEELQTDLNEAPITAHRLKHYAIKITQLWDDSVEQLTDPVIALAATLSDKQVDQILRSLEQKRQELHEQYVAPEEVELQQQRAQRIENILKSWVGKLNEPQREIIAQWSREIRASGEFVVDIRQQWQNELEGVLAKRTQFEVLQEQIKILMFYPEEKWPPQYRELASLNQARTYILLAKLNNSFTQAQLRRRDRTIKRYIEDFRELVENT